MGRVMVHFPYDGHAELPGPVPEGVRIITWVHNLLTDQSSIVLESAEYPHWERDMEPLAVTWEAALNWSAAVKVFDQRRTR